MKDIAHNETDEILEQLERKIDKIYRNIAKEHITSVELFFSKLDSEMTPQERLLFIQNKGKFEKLINQLMKAIRKGNIESVNLINADMIKTYILNGEYGAYYIEHETGLNLKWNIFNDKTIKGILEGEINPFYKLSIDGVKDKDRIYRALKGELLQSIISGESVTKIAKRVQRVIDKNKSDSIRIARTEIGRAENAGRLETFKQGEEMGLKLKKKWISTIDSRTRGSHVNMMGETVGMDELFSNGLDYPCGNGRASEVCNCRCTMVVEFEGFEKTEYEKKLDDKIKRMSFKQWKKGKFK